jgi:hypothetical protein
VDCGVRATQMGLDAITDGRVVPSVARIREIMGDQDETNYSQWDLAIDTLGSKNNRGFAASKTNSILDIQRHLRGGGFAILAVDYGKYRRSMQAKSGSLSFNGYHGILFGGWRKKNGVFQTRSFDSLLDGRYMGCPKGPVWVPFGKVRQAAEVVGKKETGSPVVFGLNLYRDATIAPTDPGDILPSPDAPSTFIDILSDLYAMADPRLTGTIEDIESMLGVTVSTTADAGTTVIAGIALKE